jgi:NAD(P)-dependent dehydrogenase (short-subunit alcohol dehydrogenase family)
VEETNMTNARAGVVVITGSTKGLGRALAEAYVARGRTVVVSGRTRTAVQAAVSDLGPTRAIGVPCDVRDVAAVRALWATTEQDVGPIDVWINNAGVTTREDDFWRVDIDEHRRVVETNLLGVMHASHTALGSFCERGRGRLWNVEGLGSDGRAMRGSGPYAASKAGVTMLSKILAKEARGTGVLVGTVRPGILATDLITDESLAAHRRFLTAVADRPERVAPWLVERMERSTRNGDTITWLTTPRLIARLCAAPFSRRDPFADRRPSVTEVNA